MFRIVFGILALPFSRLRLNALLTNRLYHVSAAPVEEGLRARENGDIEVDVSKWLDW